MSDDRDPFLASSSQSARWNAFQGDGNGGGRTESPLSFASQLRNRQDPQSSKLATPGTYPATNSPTGTMLTMQEDQSPSLFRPFSQSRVNTPPSNIQRMMPRRTVTIKSDPLKFTSFDPSDKELYDLWAPKAS
ncbi:hypothetical protein M407DRAFT_241251 [Tulasnella calospora MUT 4182]|uniref:Uncharacterized protein n=1 Tax=Tulasnella calospora MUT 4182 TaxID=1051891 RepID=A0A0C3MGD5_9AGAM|nr:hypothetical protein M407DRAFT_241251 [Tulasnella calospora MUT 4182]